ncbi:MAG: hypothetical protein ABL964_06230 [Steroidobacteraceae bacterium]
MQQDLTVIGAGNKAAALSPSLARFRRAGMGAMLGCLLLAGCGVTPSSPRVPQGIDLSGQWRLNAEQSDSLDNLLAAVKDELDPPLRRRMPESGNDAGGRMRSRRDEFVGPPRTKELIALLSQPDEMTVAQSPRELTTKSVDGTRQYVFGETSVVSITDGLGDQRVGWAAGQFVVSIRATDGRRIDHFFGFAPDRKRLQITTAVSGGGLPSVRMKRVYDRVTPG